MIDTDKAVAASGGAVFTVGGSHSIFTQTITDVPWYLIQITGSQFAFEMMFKIFAAIILAIVGGGVWVTWKRCLHLYNQAENKGI